MNIDTATEIKLKLRVNVPGWWKKRGKSGGEGVRVGTTYVSRQDSKQITQNFDR